jgi:hypothetical protein
MGLDVSHDCWHGSYSAFGRWRKKVCEVAGYGDLNSYIGFGGDKPWPTNDALVHLLDHSDCDGQIHHNLCEDIAARLEELLPALERAGDGGGHVGAYAEATKTWIEGLRDAALRRQHVTFS